MRLARTGPAGAEQPVVIDDDDTVFDLRDLTGDLDGPFLAADGIDDRSLDMELRQIVGQA